MTAQQVVEVTIPGATTEDVRLWASNVSEASPVTTGPTPFSPGVDCEVTSEPFMGAELSFVHRGRKFFTLAVFAAIPTEEEIKIMDDQSDAQGVSGG